MTAILPLYSPLRFRGGLETVVTELIGRDGNPLPEQEWRRGVEWTNMATGDTFTSGMGGGSWGQITLGDEKPVNPNPGSEVFQPVSLGAIFECQMQAPNGVQGDVSRQRALALLERKGMSDLARILYDGEAYTCAAPDGSDPNPGLIALAESLTPVGPGSIRGAFQGLLGAVCETWHADPVFLIPREFMPHFLDEVVKWDEATGSFRFGPYRVAFDCFPNVAPTAGGTTAVDGSEVWVYAMMPPAVALGESVAADGVRAELRNHYTFRAEREAIVAFDTTRVLAAKALVG